MSGQRMPDTTRTLAFDAEPRYGPGSPPDKRRMSPIAMAGTIGAVVISIGLVLALLSPVFAGAPAANKAPNLPGVLEDAGPAPTSAPSQAALPADTPSDDPSEAPASQSPPTGNPAIENAVITLVNAEREDRGDCGPVQGNAQLRDAARQHSADMAAGGFISHKGSDGSSEDDRMRAAGYDDPRSENVARGFRSAKDVVKAWMGKRENRENILDCDATTIGVGIVVSDDGTPYWTQNFGQ